MKTVHSPKRRVELVLHGTKSMKTPLIDTAVKDLHKTVAFQHQLCPSMSRLSNNVTAVIRLWKRMIHLNNPEDGDSTFSETSDGASATRYQVHEDIFILNSSYISDSHLAFRTESVRISEKFTTHARAHTHLRSKENRRWYWITEDIYGAPSKRVTATVAVTCQLPSVRCSTGSDSCSCR
jgi:hypothetical protein